jgi:hypothetical protein
LILFIVLQSLQTNSGRKSYKRPQTVAHPSQFVIHKTLILNTVYITSAVEKELLNKVRNKDEDIQLKQTYIWFYTVYFAECGVPRITLQKRIIGGNEAYFGEFPWQAHIRIAGYQCGGVLVSRWYVATAAHCIHRSVV